MDESVKRSLEDENRENKMLFKIGTRQLNAHGRLTTMFVFFPENLISRFLTAKAAEQE